MTYTVAQIAKRYRVAPHTILRWIRNGELAAIDVSRSPGGRPRWRVTQEALEQFESRRAATPPLKTARRKLAVVGEELWYA